MIRRTFAFILACSILAGAASVGQADPAVERTRNPIRVLDDLYQSSIVGSDEHRAGNFSPTADVRAVDLSGSPINPSSSPRDRFETAAARRMIQGDEWYEEVVERGGKRSLRVATPIPFSTRRCVRCHSEYKRYPQGQPIGFLSYRAPFE